MRFSESRKRVEKSKETRLVPSDKLKYFKKYFKKIEQRNISYRKLLALRTQLNIIINDKQNRYIFQENLINSIDFLLNKIDKLSEETVQYYISEYGAAIKERLAGSQLDTSNHKGFYYKSAGYQRLMLSCESLVLKCYFMYLEKVMNVAADFASRPVIFILFDYGARLSTKIPSEVIRLGLEENIPIILRLKMLKYKPWLWVTALREMARILYFISQGITPLEIFSEDPKIDAYTDSFLFHFLTEKNFLNVIKEELNYFEKIGHNSYKINPEVEEAVIRRYNSIDLTENYIKDAYLKEKDIREFSRKA